jgi:hypothetical protein
MLAWLEPASGEYITALIIADDGDGYVSSLALGSN